MRRSLFIQGPISVAFISAQIRKHQFKTNIGAHQIFLGQVRADQTDHGKISGIEYTAYESMALECIKKIKEDLFEKYPIRCMHVYHSLGMVKTGGCSLFIFVSAAHSEAAYLACQELLARVKKELPIWGKEIVDKVGYQWKLNPANANVL
ncbi:molybdopterin synthase catalytic subunit [Arachidicoccus rhizosphaerae]|uniref:Molybdopterin synthase catalytic subunit n=1 Tax=Arachidicoccus rhizosphaerae TaxID=551991 RepID=A0A1H3WCQ9_9BACT|nr:molybdenum cofactor biosynthesis protein MoaE [Arachidicoccus rhizosphaerae]SDZ84132.1 molybdopterin synthase catalytic subunit [Arachidicoccus rhizosphaerae]